MRRVWNCCSFIDCHELVYAKGLCRNHWDKNHRGTLNRNSISAIDVCFCDRPNFIKEVIQNDYLNYLLSLLKHREKKVLEFRFGLYENPCELKEAALHLGCSRERVRQIEAKALRNLEIFSRKIE